MDFDKYWHVTLFLLSEEYRQRRPSPLWTYAYERPLSWAIVGAHLSTFEEDMDVPVRYCTPTEVERIARSLETVTPKQFFSPAWGEEGASLDDLYAGFLRPDSRDDPRYANILRNLKQFYDEAAWQGEATIHALW